MEKWRSALRQRKPILMCAGSWVGICRLRPQARFFIRSELNLDLTKHPLPKYMRTFAEAYPDEPIVQQAAAQIPWFHNCTLLDKVKAPAERLWYIQQTIEYGWSRNVLVHHIETNRPT